MMKKKQVVRRMGGGPMKKQVVKKRVGGGMASPDTRGRALGRMTRDAEGRALPMMGKPKSTVGRPKKRPMTRGTAKGRAQTANDRLDERLGMKDGKESTKSQSMKSRRDESRAMKRGGVAKKRGGGTMTPMAMRRGGAPKNTRRMNDLEELGRVDAERARTSKGKKNLTAEKNRIILELARKRKPSGRLNVDDIKRASQAANRRRKK